MTDLSKLVRDLEHPTVLELKLAEALENARREAMQECAEIMEADCRSLQAQDQGQNGGEMSTADDSIKHWPHRFELTAPVEENYLLQISNEFTPLVTIKRDGTVIVHKEGADKEAARLFYSSLQIEGKLMFGEINRLRAENELLNARVMISNVNLEQNANMASALKLSLKKYGLANEQLKKRVEEK